MINITDFEFTFINYGTYMVTYISPCTGKRWSTVTHDMVLIDKTKFEINPKKKDLNELKKLCKAQ